MRVVVWIFRIALFVILLAFAAKNSTPVDVRFFFDAAWQLPLNLIILTVFVLGAAVGVSAALGTLFRQKRELTRLRREADDMREGFGRSGTGSGAP